MLHGPDPAIHRKSTFALLILIIGALSEGCHEEQQFNAEKRVRIAALSSGPVRSGLLRIYERGLQDVNFSLVESSGGLTNIELVQSGQADVSVAQSNIVYSAFTKGTEENRYPHSRLRSMALLQMSALHLMLDSDVPFISLSDLRGKRIGVGTFGSSTEITVRTVLPELGIELSELDLQRVPFSEIPQHILDGTLDGEFVFDSYPTEFAMAALRHPRVRLVPIQGPSVTALRYRYPFFRPVVIPAGTYGQDFDVETVGVRSVMFCREGLEDDIVYRMLKVFFESVRELAKTQSSYRTIALKEAPSTPIPLHPGAARYYREQELLK